MSDYLTADQIHAAWLSYYLEGGSIEAACKRVGHSWASLWRWRDAHPDEESQIRTEAQSEAADLFSEQALENFQAKARLQLNLEVLITEELLPVLRLLVKDAKEATSVWERKAALDTLRKWLTEPITGKSSAAESSLLPAGASSLPAFLTSGAPLRKLEIETVNGDRIVVEHSGTD